MKKEKVIIGVRSCSECPFILVDNCAFPSLEKIIVSDRFAPLNCPLRIKTPIIRLSEKFKKFS